MSFWGKLGQVALKAAPIAAGFIPGVGPLASMAIGGLAAGAGKKIEGGSWKDSLLSGGIGAGTGYLSGKLGDMTTSKPGGLGPSDPTKYVRDDIAKVATSGLGRSGLGSKIAMTALGASPLLGLLGGLGKKGNAQQDLYGGGDTPNGFGNFNYRNPDLNFAIRRGQEMARGIGPNTFIDPRAYGAQRNPYTGY